VTGNENLDIGPNVSVRTTNTPKTPTKPTSEPVPEQRRASTTGESLPSNQVNESERLQARIKELEDTLKRISMSEPKMPVNFPPTNPQPLTNVTRPMGIVTTPVTTVQTGTIRTVGMNII
jgi:hypothetical protein